MKVQSLNLCGIEGLVIDITAEQRNVREVSTSLFSDYDSYAHEAKVTT